MPDWTAPFKIPHMTTAEFERRRAAYIARHGYRYSIPGFEDIIHIPIEKPMTIDEEASWRSGHKEDIPPERLEEIEDIKRKRKERYLDMLGDPNYDVFRSRASILTAIDDAQDAMSTAAVVGSVAASVLPQTAAKLIQGPLGWIMTAAQALNVVTTIMSPERAAISKKRLSDSMTTDNPFSKKARLKVADRLKKAKIGTGAIIEALQTTDGVFGAGITLGAVVSLPMTIISGAARRVGGTPVQVKWPVPNWARWKRYGKKIYKSALTWHGTPHHTDDFEMTSFMLAQNAATQMDLVDCVDWNPLDKVLDIDKIEIRPDPPEKGYLLEILDELDPGWPETLVWPSTGKPWSTINDLIDSVAPIATDNLRTYCQRNNHNFMGLVGAQNACQSGMAMYEALEGPGAVEYDYAIWCKVIHSMLNAGYNPPETLSEYQKSCFVSYLNGQEALGIYPGTRAAALYAMNVCGWKF